MPSKLQKAIGAVKDQTSISLAKASSNTYSNLEVAVLKATTHDEDDPIDLVSVNDVLRLVSSNKSHAAACARAIGKRIGRTKSWVVALKSLILVLRIFQDGDPYFPREVLLAMRRGAKILNLRHHDHSSSGPHDFTLFVRTLALYLDERLECFLTGKLQRRSTHDAPRGSHRRANVPSEPVRGMKPTVLLDKISSWQRLLERAIAMRPSGRALMNRLVHVALYAIVQESFDLYKDVSDGLTLILDSFFHLQFDNCVSAFQACAKAAKQFRELSDFYSMCKSIGVGRSSEYPCVQTISEELVGALQEFLKDKDSLSSKLAGRAGPADGKATPQTRSQSTTSLEDLINASEMGTCPAISIDLEAYAGRRINDAFTNTSVTGSTRSLPVSNSMADLMSLCDWAELEEMEKQQQQEQMMNTNNWELVLAGTVSTPDNAAPFQAANHHTGWEVVLFEAPTPQQPADNHYYNPFLQDAFDHQVANFPIPATSAAPTFQAAPSFSMHNANQSPYTAQMNNDPFGPVPSFSSEPVFTNQQNLLVEQQLWLRNQNKIISKHMA